jgi:hypothetical protein
MADDTAKNDTEPSAAAEAEPERKIMCYVSKEMVPVSQTVEVEYTPGKPFRVLPKYIKFDYKPAA